MRQEGERQSRQARTTALGTELRLHVVTSEGETQFNGLLLDVLDECEDVVRGGVERIEHLVANGRSA